MKIKKWLAALLAVCLLAGLTGCGSNGKAVYVQSVADITGMGSIALDDRFPGMIVSENVTEIQWDSDKTVKELLVKEGDDVTEGQELFSYDTDELQLTLDKQKLELEQLQATVDNYTDQIATLEKEKKNASSSDQLGYTVQIQSLQVDKKEAELNIEAKKKEIEQSEKILENASVVSPVTGRVQAINENGMDNYGNPQAYITIQQAGAYRVKGTMGELQRGGIMEGTRMRVISRMDESQFWMGTVTLVDYENASQGNGNEMYYGMSSDSMTSSSKYPFYLELDSSDGLILGQHVYLEVDTGSAVGTGMQMPSYFICTADNGDTFVWAEGNGAKLEKRVVSLGAYNEMMDTYEILEGLSAGDFIAYPDEEMCRPGAPTTHEEPEEVIGGDEAMIDDGMIDDGMIDDGMFDEGMIDEGMVDGGMIDSDMADDGMIDDGMADGGEGGVG